MKNLLAIAFIWFGCAIAWMILGSTLVYRSGESSYELTNEVGQLWGTPMEQNPPSAIYHEPKKVQETVTETDAQGHQTQIQKERLVDTEVPVPIDGSDIQTKLSLEHRQKGLLWFATYVVDFQARYTIANPTQSPKELEIRFPLQSQNALYDGFQVLDAQKTPVQTSIRDGFARWTQTFAPGQRLDYTVIYRSRGTSRWTYQLTAGTGQVKNFRLAMDTNFEQVNFPAGTISPSQHKAQAGAWHGDWTFQSLVSSAPIGVQLPQKLNPGPLASRITFFAPIGLLFFCFVVAVFATSRKKAIHPLNYFFFGCTFFAFHLLFAYLVDHLSLAPSFAIASAVSILLLVSYARLFVGWRFALMPMGLSQALYLVMFSMTFFWEGFTGLAITVGAILTLFVMMQLTGRVNWAEVTQGPAAKTPPNPAV